MDTMKFTVLADGTIKIETDKVSLPNHAGAEAFIRACAELAGGMTTRTRKAQSHSTTTQQQHAEQKG